jgi:ParB family chromosome partitioning protein
MRLLKLPEPMQNAISEGLITEGHARALLMVDNPRVMQALFDQIVEEGLSVREAERLAKGVGPDEAPSYTSTPSVRTRTESDPNDAALERQLSELFGTPVKLSRAGDGGKLNVPFYSDEDLQRILELLGIEL